MSQARFQAAEVVQEGGLASDRCWRSGARERPWHNHTMRPLMTTSRLVGREPGRFIASSDVDLGGQSMAKSKLTDFMRPYWVTDGKRFRLQDVNPADTGDLGSEEKPEARELLQRGVALLSHLQEKLYARDHVTGVSTSTLSAYAMACSNVIVRPSDHATATSSPLNAGRTDSSVPSSLACKLRAGGAPDCRRSTAATPASCRARRGWALAVASSAKQASKKAMPPLSPDSPHMASLSSN